MAGCMKPAIAHGIYKHIILCWEYHKPVMRVQLVASFPVNSLTSSNWLYLAQLTLISIKRNQANTRTMSNINTAKL